MLRKSLLNDLIETSDIKELERHLFYSYLKSHNLLFSKNSILSSYFEGFDFNSRILFDVSQLGISSIKDLEQHLELMIPSEDRRLNGAFFTPDYVIDFIINEIKPKENHSNLDPSCGCGAFLIGLTDFYRKTYNKPIKKIIKENIFGSDILAYNISRTKLILTIYGLQNGENLTERDFNLYHQDSLRVKWRKSFDNVVGNPPYVKFQDLSSENRTHLIENWTTIDGGTFNLYFAFFELGYKLLKEKGKLGYITPNNYFTSLSGESLRKYFHTKKCVSRIIDFSHKRVFDAQTYTAITFLEKKENRAIVYDRIKDSQTPELFISNANGSPNFLENLSVKKWRLLKTDELNNINIIESIGQPIGKLFDICVGIATLKDDVFFVDGKSTKGNYYLKSTDKGIFSIEKEVVKPVYKISDFKSQQELSNNTRKIIFPYSIVNGTASAIPENDFKIRFPKCYEYLLSEKEVLLGRDKGKVQFEPFFVWGRTQGLTKTGKKILSPTFSQHPRFLVVNEEDAYFTNGYGLFYKNKKEGLFKELTQPIEKEENIDVLQKILNSCIMDYYIRKTSVSIEGGYPCYQKNFIEKFNIPTLSESEIKLLRKLTSQNEVDEFLITKYHLNLPFPNLAS